MHVRAFVGVSDIGVRNRLHKKATKAGACVRLILRILCALFSHKSESEFFLPCVQVFKRWMEYGAQKVCCELLVLEQTFMAFELSKGFTSYWRKDFVWLPL